MLTAIHQRTQVNDSCGHILLREFLPTAMRLFVSHAIVHRMTPLYR